MVDEDIYTFRIDAYSPETIPLARLAEYMAGLADMFGERERVHFAGLECGSTCVVSRVEREAGPKVRENLVAAASEESGDSAKAFKRLNEMLRKDNAEGLLSLDGARVLSFPGRKTVRPPRLGPFNQAIDKDGVLVRIGGKDKTAHATIEDSDGIPWSFEVTRELAKDLAHHLFGSPLRLSGHGRFFRDEEGQWQCTALKAQQFVALKAETLAEAVARIRNAEGGWASADPTKALFLLRGEDGEE